MRVPVPSAVSTFGGSNAGTSGPPRIGALRSRCAAMALVVGGALTVLIAAHGFIPNALSLGMIWENALPWAWVLLPLLLGFALIARTPRAFVGFLAPSIAWIFLIGLSLIPLGDSRASYPVDTSLTVATQNIGPLGDAAAVASSLSARNPDLIALQEIGADDRAIVGEALDEDYPYAVLSGTVGLWSRYPINDWIGLRLGLDWYRAINAVVETPAGAVSVYVIHAASARPGAHEDRDVMLAELGEAVAENSRDRVIALGDFNASSSDRALFALQRELAEPNLSEGGFGFTWPAASPLIRLDHVFARGMTPTFSTVSDAQGSDHLGIITSFGIEPAG